MSARLSLLTGGVRSGKSARALTLAEERAAGGPVLFVATAQAFDDEMARRIDIHRAERPPHWTTLEAPLDLSAALTAHVASSAHPAAIVIDCLTLWVSNILLSLDESADAEAIVAERARELLDVVRPLAATTPVVLVTNEVGLGVVPASPLGRRYRDALGRCNQVFASAADEVILLVSGIDVVIKSAR
jgi:adenosylcobinamide kinase/adenosylcobinamide-phosphate guanylyltransferase